MNVALLYTGKKQFIDNTFCNRDIGNKKVDLCRIMISLKLLITADMQIQQAPACIIGWVTSKSNATTLLRRPKTVMLYIIRSCYFSIQLFE